MKQGVGVAGIYVRDQDEAVDFYVGKLGFGIHTDARNDDGRQREGAGRSFGSGNDGPLTFKGK